MKPAILSIVLLSILVSGCTVSSNRSSNTPTSLPPENFVCFGTAYCFEVEVAQTREERMLGLMLRESMPMGNGMLFIFEETGRHPFWMKNTLMELDIIWMDENGIIKFIKRGAEPCQSDPCPMIDPGVDALYVLEIKAGMADVFSLNVGDSGFITISSASS